MRGIRPLFVAFLSVLGTAATTCADFNALLSPVPGATVGRNSLSSPPAPAAKTAPVGGQLLKLQTAAPDAQALLTENELLTAIQADLPKRFVVEGELRVTLTRPWTAIPLPAPEFFAECVQLPPGGLASVMQLTVRGVSGGKIIGEWPLQVRAEVWREVWLAPQRMDRGQMLQPSLLTARTVDILKEFNPPIAADQDLSGFELAQAVQAGKPISRKDLVERSLVRKGQFVDAVANEGGLNIRMRAQAMEAGPAGAVIRVRNLDSQKVFFAQVINENQVQVRF